MLVVRAGRERWRQHRRRRRGRSGDGLLYVAAQTGLSTMEVVKDPCSEFRYSSPHDSCGQLGALPPPPGYKKAKARSVAGGGAGGCRRHRRRLDREAQGVRRHHRVQHEHRRQVVVDSERRPASAGRVEGSVVRRREAAAGGARRGQAQVITTKSLVIYGTGRGGGPPNAKPQLFAVDKATGKQVGAVAIPSRTSAVPMTFMHKGRSTSCLRPAHAQTRRSSR